MEVGKNELRGGEFGSVETGVSNDKGFEARANPKKGRSWAVNAKEKGGAGTHT